MTNFHFPVIRCARPGQARPSQALGGLIQRSGDACGLVSKMVSYWTGIQRKSVSCQHTIHPACSLAKALLLWLLRRNNPHQASLLATCCFVSLTPRISFSLTVSSPISFHTISYPTPRMWVSYYVWVFFSTAHRVFVSFILPWGSFKVQGNK